MTQQKTLTETFDHIHPIETNNLIAEVQKGLQRTSGLVASRCGHNIDPSTVERNEQQISDIFSRLVRMPPEELNEALRAFQERLNSPSNSVVATPEYAAA